MRVRAFVPAALSVAVVAAGFFGIVLVPRAAAAVSISLYGDAGSGWGFTPTTITSPGPPITVSQFDQVNVRLEGVDAARHNFYVDYNANNAPDPATEPVSPDFRNSTGPITYPFTANVVGVFTYYCEYHQGRMRGTFTVQAANTAPTATISMPDGTRDWTGGSVNRITWNMADAQDANTALTVFLNYSSSAGSGPIAGPLPGTANPNFYDWTVPTINAIDVVVNLTVIDSGRLKGWAQASVPVVDSTAPQVTATLPTNGATNIPTTTVLKVTWSETMNTAATGSPQSFGFRPFPSGPWVGGTFSWNSPQDTLMTFTPSAPLSPGTQYQAFVNTSAKDKSDPGIALSVANTWTFTTGTTADTQPPQISSLIIAPTVQKVGGAVNVSAIATDNVGLAGVWLDVTSLAGKTNASMNPGVGGRYFLNRTYTDLGVHGLTIWASDTSGLWSSTTGQFTIVDAQPPTIAHTPPASATLGKSLNITATVKDNDVVARVKLNWTDVTGRNTNATLSSSGPSYWLILPVQLRLGSLSYFLWAQDAAGNAARTATVTLQIRAPAGAILLYGQTISGWGFGADNITSPGPTIQVRLGATVDILLIGVDAVKHNFFVDYNGDSGVSAGEPVSADFRGNTTRFTFVADRAGSFTYFYQYHIGTMRGSFVVSSDAPPGGGTPPSLWIAVGLGLVAAGAVLAAFVIRRRRRLPRPPGT